MKPSVSFIVLFYRDQPTVAPVLRAVHRTLTELCERFEIVAIDDCSRDGTDAEIRAVAAGMPEVIPIVNAVNLGVGGSFRTAVAQTRYPWIGYTDGDDQYEFDDLRTFLPHLADHDVITGWRRVRGDGWRRTFASGCFNRLTRGLFPLPVRDINSALKLYRGELLRALPPWDPGAFYDTEILVRLHRDFAARIKEVPIRHKARSHGVATGISRRNVVNVLANLAAPRMASYRRRIWRTPAADHLLRGAARLAIRMS